MKTREISDEQAEQEVLDLFRGRYEPLYYPDIVEALNLDMTQVARICDKLLIEDDKIMTAGLVIRERERMSGGRHATPSA